MKYANWRGGAAWVVFSAVSAAVSAQTGASMQTWVSGYGSDGGNCAFASPCRTFARALAQTAPGGEISVLDPGPFGPATITAGVTINGVGAYGSIVVPNGAEGIRVSTTQATDVVMLRGLSLKGSASIPSHGIRSDASAGTLHIENCAILGFAGQGIWFAPTGTSSLFVSNTSVRGTYGVLIEPAASGTAVASLNNLKLENNSRAVRVSDGATVAVRNTVGSGNSSNGFIAQGVARPARLSIDNSVAAFNGSTPSTGSGVVATNLATVWVSNSLLTGNAYGMTASSGGQIITYANNRVMGNTTADTNPSGGTITAISAQ